MQKQDQRSFWRTSLSKWTRRVLSIKPIWNKWWKAYASENVHKDWDPVNKISPSGSQRTAKHTSMPTKNARHKVGTIQLAIFTWCPGKCPKEAKCPSGAIFIEDASYMIEENDGNGDLGIGVRYRIRHSLITVIPPHSPDGSDPHVVTEFRTDANTELEVNQKSETKHALLVSAFVIIGIMCGLLVLCGYVSYKCTSKRYLSCWTCDSQVWSVRSFPERRRDTCFHTIHALR